MKNQVLLKQINKDKTWKGLKEMIVNEFLENAELKYSNKDTIEDIMGKVKEFVNENRWSKTVKLVNEFKKFKQRS